MKRLCMIVLALSPYACQSGLTPISQRDFYEKEGKSPNLGHRRPIEEKSEASPEIYVKRENLLIHPKKTENYTGSLFALKRAENNLYGEPARGALGEMLDIQVKVNRSEASASPPAASPNPAATPKGSKELQDELIAALPKLEPSEAKAKVPTQIKMQVVKIFENGDVLVEATRASKNEWESNSIRAMSRLPRAALQANRPLTTEDLSQVDWYEIQGAQTIERESSTWEDEYTMRWAGFDEARSKSALELEGKRKDLEKVKTRLQERINNMGKERGQIAAERERLKKLREEAEIKLKEMGQKIDNQAQLIEQQKEAILKQQALIGEKASPEREKEAAKPANNQAQPAPPEGGAP